MMSYTSRDGELAVENERGERVLGKDALAEQRADWAQLFDNRAASRDLGVFHVTIDGASLARDADRVRAGPRNPPRGFSEIGGMSMPSRKQVRMSCR